MNCDLCGQAIHWWQDRHSTGSGNFHSACEVHDAPLEKPQYRSPKFYKMNWFTGRVSIDPNRDSDE